MDIDPGILSEAAQGSQSEAALGALSEAAQGVQSEEAQRGPASSSTDVVPKQAISRKRTSLRVRGYRFFLDWVGSDDAMGKKGKKPKLTLYS